MPAKPQLDHYIGRSVIDLMGLTNEEGDQEGFAIQLDGDIQVVIEDEDAVMPAPEVLKGTQFIAQTLSESETTMLFGDTSVNPVNQNVEQVVRMSVRFSPMKYRIADARYENGPFYPQRGPDASEQLPPEPEPPEAQPAPEEAPPTPPTPQEPSESPPPPELPPQEEQTASSAASPQVETPAEGPERPQDAPEAPGEGGG